MVHDEEKKEPVSTEELIDKIKVLARKDDDAFMGLIILMIERMIHQDHKIAELIECQQMLTGVMTVLTTSTGVNTDSIHALNQAVDLIKTHYMTKKVM
jgi:hypothetical protein